MNQSKDKQEFQILESLPEAGEGDFGPNGEVVKRKFHIPELLLQNGQVLRGVEFGYECYGRLNVAKNNAVLILHYFSGTSHAAGRYDASDAEPGYWDTIIGPGKAIDTNRYFVIAVDSLCNVNTHNPQVVTTGPCSIDPATGARYGKDFPVISIGDMVCAQKKLCDAFGIEELHAVAGPSMGSLQAMEWAARYPEKVTRVLSAIPAGLATESYLIAMLDLWMAPIYLDAKFRGGDYVAGQEPVAGLTQSLKLVTFTALHYQYTRRLFGRRWADSDQDPALSLEHGFAASAALEQLAAARAHIADANSFLRLARAVQLFSIEERRKRLRAKFLVIPALTDLLMYPDYSLRGADELRSLGLEVQTFELEGDGGHLDGLHRIAQAGPAIRAFLDT
jgi:homoserine O-acetyltransferase